MIRLKPVLLTAIFILHGTVQAQTTDEPWQIRQGELRTGHIGSEEVHTFVLEIEQDYFVYGEANQISVDLIVSIYAPDGDIIKTFDNPARGPESFQFDTAMKGAYRIELKPFEKQAGNYSLALHLVEPKAQSTDKRVDQLLSAFHSFEAPGAVVGVIKEGEMVLSKAYGMADLSHEIPFSTETLTNIGSTSKQFTAFAIALLAERGQLSLDDDVRTHIPELPDFGQTITLRHMMTHTTGFREFLNTIALTGRQLEKGDYIDRNELIDVVKRQPALQNDPGAEWNYNNTAFGLLTIVVERVIDQTFPAWMKENVFDPLGMQHTMVRKNQSEIVPNRSVGYLMDEEGLYTEAADLGGAMGAGGIYTTVGDLSKWMANYHDPKVGSAALIEQMTTPYVLTTGDTTNYGLGLFIDELRGLKRYQHGGADIAHRSMYMYFPEINSGVIALSNLGSFSNPATEIAELFFGDKMMQEASVEVSQNETIAFDPEQYDAASFDDFAGRYALDAAPQFIMTFMREGDQLFTQATGQPKFEIFPISDSTFKLTVVEASMTFHRESDGTVKSMTLHQNGNNRATRLEDDPQKLTIDEQAAFAGRYFSEELETFYTVVASDSGLVLSQRRLGDIKLAPSKVDVFGSGFPVGEIAFTRDEEQRVNGFTVSNGRTRGVRFDKQ